MYSGTTLTKASGRVLGAHQKIDRVARNHLSKLLPDDSVFPVSRKILHFEGKNGPDAIKRKSPAQDEPWHYYSPFDEKDSQLIELINRHYNYLVKELKDKNAEKVAFEAAWLAHALVDGLTPAHHYPYEQKLAELRGEGIETRTTIKEKLVLPGETRREQVKNNWKMWGPKGLFTAHGLFEMGIATLIAPMKFSDRVPDEKLIAEMKDIGLAEWFTMRAREIAVLDIFERYIRRGWTTRLAFDVRNKLAPTIINTVTLAWYCALLDAGVTKHKKT
jgi:hypothetical protein